MLTQSVRRQRYYRFTETPAFFPLSREVTKAANAGPLAAEHEVQIEAMLLQAGLMEPEEAILSIDYFDDGADDVIAKITFDRGDTLSIRAPSV